MAVCATLLSLLVGTIGLLLSRASLGTADKNIAVGDLPRSIARPRMLIIMPPSKQSAPAATFDQANAPPSSKTDLCLLAAIDSHGVARNEAAVSIEYGGKDDQR